MKPFKRFGNWLEVILEKENNTYGELCFLMGITYAVIGVFCYSAYILLATALNGLKTLIPILVAKTGPQIWSILGGIAGFVALTMLTALLFYKSQD